MTEGGTSDEAASGRSSGARRIGGSASGVPKRRGAVAAWIESQQARLRYVFTVDELSPLPISAAARDASLARLRAAGRITRVGARRGTWVIVPPEHRTMGVPPISWLLDDVMRAFGQPYYLGLNSAAALYGATHYAVQVAHIVTTSPLRPVGVGRLRLRFVVKPDLMTTPVREVVDVTRMRVSTPEATAVDLVRFMAQAGGVSRVATTLSQMLPAMRPAGVRDALDAAHSVALAQRLGYLWTILGQPTLAAVTRDWVDARIRHVVALEHRQAATEASVIDPTWQVRVDHPIDLTL